MYTTRRKNKVYEISQKPIFYYNKQIQKDKTEEPSENSSLIKEFELEKPKYVHDLGINTQKPKKRRRKYIYPNKIKEEAIKYANAHGLKEASIAFNISKKNIERWQSTGLERKKGAGRKTTNPVLEQDMLKWVEDYIKRENKIPRRKYIITKAKEYQSESFKASKGWCDKFIKRNKTKLTGFINSIKQNNN